MWRITTPYIKLPGFIITSLPNISPAPSVAASTGNDEHTLELIVQLETEANLMLSCVFAKWHKPLWFVGQQTVVRGLQKCYRYKWREINIETYSDIIDINRHYTFSLIM